MGLEDLRKVVLSERESGRLTQIPPDLYAKAHAAIAALMEQVHAIDPFSDEARTLIEETVAIRETVFDLIIPPSPVSRKVGGSACPTRPMASMTSSAGIG